MNELKLFIEKATQLKPKDLMLGDWVCAGSTIDQVAEIAYDESAKPYMSIAASATLFRIYFEQGVSPILLTEEILQQNGFIKSNQVSDTPPYDEGEDGEKFYSVDIEGKDTFWGWWQKDNTFLIPANGLGWITLKYVHQLQHLMRLCIDRDITL